MAIVSHSIVRAIVLLASCVTAFLSTGCSKKEEKPRGRPPALVVTAVSNRQDVPVLIKAIGTMEASESVSIRSQISGELIKVGFREGEDVQKGTLLFQFDPRTYQAALRKAEAALARNRAIMANARRDYDRYSQLFRDGIVTQEQAEGYRTRAEAAEADVASDQAAVDTAREQLRFCTITAPVSGRAGVLSVDRGNVVKANDTVLVTINKLTPIHASFTIPEKLLPEIKRHISSGKVDVQAEISGSSAPVASGSMFFLDNTVDPATGTIRLKALFRNVSKQLWPGQFVNLSIVLETRKNAVVVPSQSVQTGQKGQFVFVVKADSTAEIRPVVAGPSAKGMTVIENGLQGGEQVVIDGQMRVVPGGKVEIKQPDKSGSVKSAPAGCAGAKDQPAANVK